MIYKNCFFKYFFFFLFLFKLCYNNCVLYSFPELKYPKVQTLENGYHLMITTTGIFSFYPGLSDIFYSYNFTNDEIILPGLDSMDGTINQVEISQFREDNGGKRYIVAIAKYFIYFMNEKGKILFKSHLSDINVEYTISLNAYKYLDNKYYFIISYNYHNSQENKKCLMLNKYHIEIQSGQYRLEMDSQQSFNPDSNGNTYLIHPNGLSCHIMISSINNNKALTCFESIQADNNIIFAFSFNPESFTLLSASYTYFHNENNKEATYIKTCINNERTKALICYSNVESGFLKCIYYEINDDKFTYLTLFSDFCNTNYFGYNIYFFNQRNEYILTCDNKIQKIFHIVKLDQNYNIIGDDQLNDCDYLDFSSFIYVLKYDHYSVIINSKLDNKESVRIFQLTNNDCIPINEREKEKDYSSDIEEMETVTTIPEILTTIPIIETTIPIIPTTIITTIPKIETTIITTIPIIETTIITTIPIKETTIFSTYTNVETTILNYITTLPESENNIITTIPNSISETTNIENNNKFPSSYLEDSTWTISEDIEQYNLETEELCKDNNKIYKSGKCICDNESGFFSVNINPPDDNCYKKEEISDNFYYNNITHSYELCFESCKTCNKAGNFSENNCITCVEGYTKEPKNPLNCVEKCQYLYYYNSFEQYSCTEIEQCPDDASLIIRDKNKCVSKCLNDETNKYQYNGECLFSCPNNTKVNEYFICQITNISICSSTDYELNLDDTIYEDNVKLTVKNYASEFSYTENHISKFTSKNFTMVLYKNSSCIDELKLNITKIEYDSCISQLKKDNNIDNKTELISAVINIINGEKQITSFGFFNPITGEKLNASKSCSDKNVTMYENILSVLNNPTALELLQQNINIFDLNSEFYNEICFHFNSPNGKDATLKDRIKTFYPNITLCDPGCRNKGINITTLKAECECTFQDLLSKKILDNALFGNNVLIKESLQEIEDLINNLNIEILMCYKDIFDIKYFKKNISGFIIISLFVFYTICIIYYFLISKHLVLRTIYSLSEKYFLYILKNKNKNKNSKIKKFYQNNHKGTHSPNKKNKKILMKDDNNIIKRKSIKNKKEKKSIAKKKTIDIGKINFKRKSISGWKRKSGKSFGKINLKQFNILNFNFKSIKNDKNSKDRTNRSTSKLLKNKLNLNIENKNKTINKNIEPGYFMINDIDLKEFLEDSSENMDYDEVIEEDKRTFCQYLGEKIKDNQIILNIFFVSEIVKPKSIKIAYFIMTIDIYFFTNGLFYSESYISERFNSKGEEKPFSFISRSIDRFIYSTIVANIIAFIFSIFFEDEKKIKKILLKKEPDLLTLRYDINRIIKSTIKKINLLIIINYIIIIFSWYYLSCFNNVYPKINEEWIFSSLFIIAVMQIMPIILAFNETSIRYMSIKFESEKLFKLSLLLS